MESDSVLRIFEIELDTGNETIFHGGELITGNLKIELKRPMTIQVIKLQFKGRASWLDECSKNGEIEKVYFDKDFTLLERPPGRPEPGHFPWIANFTYKLPFECPLPIGCPTSFESSLAFIRYYIRAIIVEEVGTDTREYMVKKALSIVSPESSTESASHPVGASETISFGGCCCRGKLTADVQLPKSEYVPGESVIGTLKIDNRHPRHIVDQIEVRFVDKATRVGNSAGVQNSQRTLLHRKLEKADVVKSKTALQREDFIFLQIPAVSPSTAGITAPHNSEIFSLSPNKEAPTASSKQRPLPATATLRFRRQPFIRIEYAIQVSLGRQLLLELPITILPLPIAGSNIVYEPFIAGPQVIDESDETNKKKISKCNVFTPMYPIFRSSSTPSLQVNGVTDSEGNR